MYGINLAGFNEKQIYSSNSSFELRKMKERANHNKFKIILNVFNKFKDTKIFPIKNIYDMNLIYAFGCEYSYGIIIAPSNLDQLLKTLLVYEFLKSDTSSNLIKEFYKIKNLIQ